MHGEYYIDIGSILEVVLQSLFTEELTGFVSGMQVEMKQEEVC